MAGCDATHSEALAPPARRCLINETYATRAGMASIVSLTHYQRAPPDAQPRDRVRLNHGKNGTSILLADLDPWLTLLGRMAFGRWAPWPSATRELSWEEAKADVVLTDRRHGRCSLPVWHARTLATLREGDKPTSLVDSDGPFPPAAAFRTQLTRQVLIRTAAASLQQLRCQPRPRPRSSLRSRGRRPSACCSRLRPAHDAGHT